MRKKFLCIAALCVIALSTTAKTFALSPEDMADYAMAMTKAAGNYGQVTLGSANTSAEANANTTVWLQSYELAQTEGTFKQLVANAWLWSQSGNQGFLQYIQQADARWVAIYQSGAQTPTERAKGAILDNFYTNFVKVWNDPSMANIPIVTQPTIIVTPPVLSVNTRTFTLLTNYTTASGKSYPIYQTNDSQYRYSKTAKSGFASVQALENFLEKQNRIIYTAPNGKKFGIFKQDNKFFFNRDNGSVSNYGFSSIDAAKSYLESHNK